MIDSARYAVLELARVTLGATIALGKGMPSLPRGRSRLSARPILRPASTHLMESAI
jgi:hypothetical protein